MDIGIPREIKILEGRIALTPEAIQELVNLGHQVIVQENAGHLSGYSDSDYVEAGAIVVDSA